MLCFILLLLLWGTIYYLSHIVETIEILVFTLFKHGDIDQTLTPFALGPNGTVPNGIDPKLVRIGPVFTLQLLEPFDLGTLSVLSWLL